jgi:Protein of unknown function (DUF2846)
MRIWRLLTICALTTLAGGASSSGAKFTEMNAVAPRLTPDKGRIYFYRSGSIGGVAVQPEIRLNNELVGRAVPGGFFFVDRSRGSYEASTTTEVETKLAFALAGGETKYIRVSISMGILVGHMQFELVNKAVAEAELASLNRV